MQTSQSVAAIAAALAKAQKVIRPAVFDRTNPHFKNKYATLPSVVEALRSALADNGIAVLQGVEAEGAQVKVTTMLAHSSGEWFQSTLTLTATQNTPQGVGSALTYGRRFGLSSLACVVADEDDDANAASETPKATGNGKPPAPQPPARRTIEERKMDIVAELKALGFEDAGVKLWVKEVLGHDKATTYAEVDRLESALVIVRSQKNSEKNDGLNY